LADTHGVQIRTHIHTKIHTHKKQKQIGKKKERKIKVKLVEKSHRKEKQEKNNGEKEEKTKERKTGEAWVLRGVGPHTEAARSSKLEQTMYVVCRFICHGWPIISIAPPSLLKRKEP